MVSLAVEQMFQPLDDKFFSDRDSFIVNTWQDIPVRVRFVIEHRDEGFPFTMISEPHTPKELLAINEVKDRLLEMLFRKKSIREVEVGENNVSFRMPNGDVNEWGSAIIAIER